MAKVELKNIAEAITATRNTYVNGEFVPAGKTLVVGKDIEPEDAAALLNIGKARPADKKEEKKQ